MSSLKSSRKRTNKIYSEEIEPFHLFHQLTSMSAIATAGVPRGKVFELAQEVDSPPAKFFGVIDNLSTNLRYNYPDACKMIGERVKEKTIKSFLFRLADALRSGEPLPPFLVREAQVQGDVYESEYERSLESLKKWNDGYTSVTISVALIVIINMVSTMIYDLGEAMMAGMVFTAIAMGFGVAWVLSRAAPYEDVTVPWAEGSPEQKRALKMLKILGPATAVIGLVLLVLGVEAKWAFMALSIIMFPMGFFSARAESQVAAKDQEVSAFLRSLGGTATSRSTTLGRALGEIELDSFPALRPNIRTLELRLRAGAYPETCWRMFGKETGSALIDQATGIFYEATNLGGDPEKTGLLCSMFASKIAMLRANRKGIAATFVYLTLVMHVVVSALMVFILEILGKFISMIEATMAGVENEAEVQQMASQMLSFGGARNDLLKQLTLALLVLMCLTNAFAVVSSEGTHIAKITFYASIMLFTSALCLFIVPGVVDSIL